MALTVIYEPGIFTIFGLSIIVMKKLLAIIFSVISIVAGCTTHEDRVIEQASSILQSMPDSSLYLLESIDCSKLKTQRQKARYSLYLSAALDKNYIDVASDSLIRPALDYYYSHGPKKEQMLTWYYYGIVLNNGKAHTSAVVAFEKALELARTINDSHYSGLSNRNIAIAFSQSNNIPESITYLKAAVNCFESSPSDSVYAIYAQYSLASSYLIAREYHKADSILSIIRYKNHNNTLNHFINEALAEIELWQNNNPEHCISLFRLIPEYYLSFIDFATCAMAYERIGKSDSADVWLNKGYAVSLDKGDSATLDYSKSRILSYRGDYDEAFHLLYGASQAQDSVTRKLLEESVGLAQRDMFRADAELQRSKVNALRKRQLLELIIIVLSTSLLLSLLYINNRRKEQMLKELMAKLALHDDSIVRISKENADLMSTHYSERIRNIDSLSREYYTSDNETRKDIVFRQFKEYIGNLHDNDAFYSSLEEDLNRYCYGIMEKFREQVPEIHGRNLKLTALFFAGLSYETVAIIIQAQSIPSLKTQKSRIRRIIDESKAPDSAFFLEMLEKKRQQTRRTNEMC